MMFAELAAERLRQETEHRGSTYSLADVRASALAARNAVHLPSQSDRGYVLPKPQAQRSYTNFSMSPLTSPVASAKKFAAKMGNTYQTPSQPLKELQPIILPTTPAWTPLTFSNFMRLPSEMTHVSCPVVPRPIRKVPVDQSEVTGAKPGVVKHAVTTILGVSNKVNTDPFNHRNSSPFQLVKKGDKPQ
ncbi:unnamed protein product [Strongylus vulgaris]|uniref:Uncharacterized protein n=1 Tax=Strongylus vulgaris TaxID=40348 RepID=A0A3P7IQF3_STRVU|nr:unnamed protein product [Strongylus vulgaris]